MGRVTAKSRTLCHCQVHGLCGQGGEAPGTFQPPSFVWPTQVPPPRVSALCRTPPPWYSLQPALSRPSGHHVGHYHGPTRPVSAAGDRNAEAPAGVLRGDRRRDELLLSSGTKVLPWGPNCHSLWHPLECVGGGGSSPCKAWPCAVPRWSSPPCPTPGRRGAGEVGVRSRHIRQSIWGSPSLGGEPQSDTPVV